MGRSGMIVLIAIVLLAVGAFLVMHKKWGADTSTPATATPAAAPAP